MNLLLISLKHNLISLFCEILPSSSPEKYLIFVVSINIKISTHLWMHSNFVTINVILPES